VLFSFAVSVDVFLSCEKRLFGGVFRLCNYPTARWYKNHSGRVPPSSTRQSYYALTTVLLGLYVVQLLALHLSAAMRSAP
jgi:hypothetical protein